MKKTISTDKAPQAIGPYSQAIQNGNLMFISGQIPIDPATGKVIAGSIEDQAHQVMKNIRAICETAGATLASIVKTTVFVTDLAQFQAVNAVYAQYFENDPPARSTVQVAALPLGVGVEIESVVIV